MKSFIALAFFVAAASAASISGEPKDAYVVRYDNDNIGVEGYSYNVETSDGKFSQESAVLKNAGAENAAISVKGQYSYTGPDGVVYTVSYTADENGFNPSGAHLPQAV